MSTESEDERIARWERGDRQRDAAHRRRMRWWRHMRQYVSMKRLLVYRLVADTVRPPCADTPKNRTSTLPDHPPWSHDSNWWPRITHWSRTRTS